MTGLIAVALATASVAVLIGLIIIAKGKGDNNVHAGLTLLEPELTAEEVDAELEGILAATAARETGDAVDAHFDTLPQEER